MLPGRRYIGYDSTNLVQRFVNPPLIQATHLALSDHRRADTVSVNRHMKTELNLAAGLTSEFDQYITRHYIFHRIDCVSAYRDKK